MPLSPEHSEFARSFQADPRLHLREFHSILLEIADSLSGSDFNPANLLPRNFDGDRIPVRPDAADVANTQTARFVYEELLKTHNAAFTAGKLLKVYIGILIGTTIIKRIQPGPGGLSQMQVFDIIAALDDTYGTLTQGDVARLEASASAFQLSETLEAFYVRFLSVISVLTAARHYTNPLQSLTLFKTSLNKLPTYTAILAAYEIAHPLLADQSVAAINTWCVDRQHLAPVPHAYMAHVEPQYALQGAYDAGFANAVQHFQGGGGGGGGHYCFKHGHHGHRGTRCTFMLTDIEKPANDPTKIGYTAAHLNAQGPMLIGGIAGHA